MSLTATAGTYTVSEDFGWEIDPRSASPMATSTKRTCPAIAVSVTICCRSMPRRGRRAVSYTASGLPGGLSINATTGVISGTMTATVSGTPDSATITASDGTASATESFDWSIVPVVLPTIADQANVGQATINLALSDDVASGSYTASYSGTGIAGRTEYATAPFSAITGTLKPGDTGTTCLSTVTAVAGERPQPKSSPGP